jgi:hypothetical protein
MPFLFRDVRNSSFQKSCPFSLKNLAKESLLVWQLVTYVYYGFAVRKRCSHSQHVIFRDCLLGMFMYGCRPLLKPGIRSWQSSQQLVTLLPELLRHKYEVMTMCVSE